MNEFFSAELSAWLTQVGLAGTPEQEIVFGFCERCVAAGMPLARGLVAIDTLDPVHEGRVFRWGYNPGLAPMVEYGRTSQEGLAASGFDPQDVEAARRWRNSAFYHMLQTGAFAVADPNRQATQPHALPPPMCLHPLCGRRLSATLRDPSRGSRNNGEAATSDCKGGAAQEDTERG
jgi:hypothetical protein